jgi:hypothetical protein
MNPYVLLGAGVALVAAFAGGAWTGYDYASSQCKAAEADRRALVDEIRTANLQLSDAIAARTETAIGQIRVVNKIINNEVRHEREIHTKVLENPDCAVPASTVGVLNRARGHPDGGSDAGEPARALPAAPAPAKPAAPGGGAGGS